MKTFKNYLYTLFITIFTAAQFYLIWFGYSKVGLFQNYDKIIVTLIIMVVFTILDKFVRQLTGKKAILLSFVLGPIRIVPQLIALFLIIYKGYRSEIGNLDTDNFLNTLYYVLFTIDKDYPHGIPQSSSRSSSRRNTGRRVGNHSSSQQLTPRSEISNALDKIAHNYSTIRSIYPCNTSLDIRTSVDVRGCFNWIYCFYYPRCSYWNKKDSIGI